MTPSGLAPISLSDPLGGHLAELPRQLNPHNSAFGLQDASQQFNVIREYAARRRNSQVLASSRSARASTTSEVIPLSVASWRITHSSLSLCAPSKFPSPLLSSSSLSLAGMVSPAQSANFPSGYGMHRTNALHALRKNTCNNFATRTHLWHLCRRCDRQPQLQAHLTSGTTMTCTVGLSPGMGS